MRWKCDILETKCYRFLLPLHQFDTQLPLSPHWHASLLLRLCEVTRLYFHTNTRAATLMKACVPVCPPSSPAHTFSLTSHTQTKKCYLAAVPLLMCRECWSQFFSHTQWTYVSQKQGRLCIPSSEIKKSSLRFHTALLKSPHVERPRVIRGGDLVACLRACLCSNACMCACTRVVTKGGSEMP